MSVYSFKYMAILAKSQLLISTWIQQIIHDNYMALILSPSNPSPCKPLVCPRVLDPAYYGELALLMVDLTNSSIAVSPLLHIKYIQPISVNNIKGYAICGSLGFRPP